MLTGLLALALFTAPLAQDVQRAEDTNVPDSFTIVNGEVCVNYAPPLRRSGFFYFVRKFEERDNLKKFVRIQSRTRSSIVDAHGFLTANSQDIRVTSVGPVIKSNLTRTAGKYFAIEQDISIMFFQEGNSLGNLTRVNDQDMWTIVEARDEVVKLAFEDGALRINRFSASAPNERPTEYLVSGFEPFYAPRDLPVDLIDLDGRHVAFLAVGRSEPHQINVVVLDLEKNKVAESWPVVSHIPRMSQAWTTAIRHHLAYNGRIFYVIANGQVFATERKT